MSAAERAMQSGADERVSGFSKFGLYQVSLYAFDQCSIYDAWTRACGHKLIPRERALLRYLVSITLLELMMFGAQS